MVFKLFSTKSLAGAEWAQPKARLQILIFQLKPEQYPVYYLICFAFAKEFCYLNTKALRATVYRKRRFLNFLMHLLYYQISHNCSKELQNNFYVYMLYG